MVPKSKADKLKSNWTRDSPKEGNTDGAKPGVKSLTTVAKDTMLDVEDGACKGMNGNRCSNSIEEASTEDMEDMEDVEGSVAEVVVEVDEVDAEMVVEEDHNIITTTIGNSTTIVVAEVEAEEEEEEEVGTTTVVSVAIMEMLHQL